MKLLLVGGAGHVGQLITPYLKAQHSLREPVDGGGEELDRVADSRFRAESRRAAAGGIGRAVNARMLTAGEKENRALAPRAAAPLVCAPL